MGLGVNLIQIQECKLIKNFLWMFWSELCLQILCQQFDCRLLWTDISQTGQNFCSRFVIVGWTENKKLASLPQGENLKIDLSWLGNIQIESIFCRKFTTSTERETPKRNTCAIDQGQAKLYGRIAPFGSFTLRAKTSKLKNDS